ncbi:MAG: serine/threonine-protein kinase [Planctomycetota bacterium]|nr:serine/threonine-protein kinase [Planctomycetota bacterium]
MGQDPAGTYQPWDPGEAPHLRLASTREVADPETHPTQTLRYEPPEVSEMLERISRGSQETAMLRPIGIGEDLDKIDAGSDFVVLHEIGRGGVGVVSAAEQVSLGRSVALKQLRSDRDSGTSRSRLIEEAKVQARLMHPVIPPVYLIGQGHDSKPVLVMQLIRGECWTDLLIRDARKLNSGSESAILEHLEILIRIGEAIAYSHGQGVIHRDIKPGNVMVGRYGEVYLVDWGLAEQVDSMGKVKTHGFTGTPAYAAPEMIQRDTFLTTQTDIYLLGSVLCEILTGYPPHRGDSIKEVFLNITKGTQVQFPSWVPGPLAALCRRAIDPEPTLRFNSAEDMIAAIREYIEHHQSIGMLDRVREHVIMLDQLVQDGADIEVIDDLGQTCRAMLEALRVQMPESEEITTLHRRCSMLMINRMIEANNPGAARIMLESLPKGPETQALQERVTALTARLLAKPTHMATNVQLMLTEQLVEARRRINSLEEQLKQNPPPNQD